MVECEGSQETGVLNNVRVSRIGSLERGTYLDVCTPVFVFILFCGDLEGPLSEACGYEGQEKLFLSPFLKLQD